MSQEIRYELETRSPEAFIDAIENKLLGIATFLKAVDSVKKLETNFTYVVRYHIKLTDTRLFVGLYQDNGHWKFKLDLDLDLLNKKG